MKEETIEQAAKKEYYYEYGEDTSITDKKRDAFIAGANWLKNQMYTEEDMLKAFRAGQDYENFDCRYAFKEWFETFKK